MMASSERTKKIHDRLVNVEGRMEHIQGHVHEAFHQPLPRVNEQGELMSKVGQFCLNINHENGFFLAKWDFLVILGYEKMALECH